MFSEVKEETLTPPPPRRADTLFLRARGTKGQQSRGGRQEGHWDWGVKEMGGAEEWEIGNTVHYIYS